MSTDAKVIGWTIVAMFEWLLVASFHNVLAARRTLKKTEDVHESLRRQQEQSKCNN